MSRRRKLLLTVAILLLGLVGGEVWFRLQTPPDQLDPQSIFTYDSRKVYTLKQSHTGSYLGQRIVTNSLGHRDSEVALVKPAGTQRVLVLGDSVSFGHGVGVLDTWPQKLEGLLNHPGAPSRTEVINTAAPGNTAYQELWDLERSLSLSPDLVVVQFALNDVVEPYRFLKRLGGAGIDYHGIPDISYGQFLLIHYSVLARALILGGDGEDPMARASAIARAERYADQRLVQTPEDPHIQAAWVEYRAWLRRLVGVAQEHALDVILVASPMDFQLLQPAEAAAPQRELAKAASELGIGFVDLLPTLREAAGANAEGFARQHFLDHTHYHPPGHALVARTVAPVVQARLQAR